MATLLLSYSNTILVSVYVCGPCAYVGASVYVCVFVAVAVFLSIRSLKSVKAACLCVSPCTYVAYVLIHRLAFFSYLLFIGFDINCGVRLLRTNLMEADVSPVKEQLAQSLFDHIPVGVGSKVFVRIAT